MASIRGSNSTIQASPSIILLNKTINAIAIINNSTYHPNMTSDELTLAIGEPIQLPEVTITELKNYTSFIIPFILVVIIIIGIVNYIQMKINKNKLDVHNLIRWAMNTYKEYTIKEVLPIYHKKAKQSPFVGAMPCPLSLPTCPRLDSTEKGQNLKVQFSIPYRRFQSSENLNMNEAHHITITTVVEKPFVNSSK